MTATRLDFGFYPEPLHLRSSSITIEPLPKLADAVATIEADPGTENGWFAPPQQTRNLLGETRSRPYPARVFGLPKTHAIEHANPDSEDHLKFHIWALSFFMGMRLSATEAGFLDATPIKPGKLVDFVLLGKSLEKAIDLAETFWVTNRPEPHRARLVTAAVHALFLAQNPRHLQFERFMLLYAAIDACFALAKSAHPPRTRVSHARRVDWMCKLFGIATPTWADPAAPSGPELAALRNNTIHEALFMGEPLGFALHGVGTNQNLTLEMEALTCRLLVALIGGAQADYVRTPVNTRQCHGLGLS